jgi:hypothetical protein
MNSRVFLIANPLRVGTRTENQRWEMHGKLKMALYILIQQQKKTIKGDLVTDKEYSNFHLKLDWKVAPKANSGIIFYINEDPIKYKIPMKQV